MNRNSFLNKGILQGLISLLLVSALVAGLCLPGMNMKTAEPRDPLDAQEILDITMLEVSENISDLTPIVVPTGGSAKPTEPQEEEENAETPTPEQSDEGQAEQENRGDGDGDKDGDTEGLQGEEGGTLVPKLAVVLTWKENRSDSRSLSCQPSGTVFADVLNNRLSGGALSYEVSLAGEDVGNAMIEHISWQSDSATGTLNQRGTLYLQGGTYRITAAVVVNGQRVPFHFELNHITDVTLKMEYTLRENGRTVTREVTCENARSRTVEEIYRDQLTNDMLSYRFSIAGVEGGAEITSVSCFQSGSGSSVQLEAEGELPLLLKNGKTGENTFTVHARSESGDTYRFTISVPYKPRGAEIIQIETYDLVDGQTVTTGSTVNFRLSAYRPEDSGAVYIPAEGTDTVFQVFFDGLPISPDSSNGRVHDFIVVPPDPVVGDTDEYSLYIYAEDSFGNWGQKTLKLHGQRAQEGQIIGTANIYVDMTVLGLGIKGPVEYDVLADEPVSYVILKAIAGQDMGSVYGSAKESFGWAADHDGSPEPNRGFYLKRIYPGLSATALHHDQWTYRTENDRKVIDLDAIDAYFGADIDMATLWRCIARNGIAKSGPGPDGGFGEFDYTSSSGWMYTVNGIIPTEGVDKYSLKDGDTLTLLYTLAGGWDVGGAGAAEENLVGYCIRAEGGRLVTNHIWDEDQCVCCGRVQVCPHENRVFVDLQNGQHVEHCNDCGEDVGSPGYHIWKQADGDFTNHSCEVCGTSDAHFWLEKQVIKPPTCTEAGEVLYACQECLMEKTEYPTTGHQYGGADTWEFDNSGHFKKCQAEGCDERGETIPFRFYWDEDEEDYLCDCDVGGCDILHCWNVHGVPFGYDGELLDDQSTCIMEVRYCADCGNYLYKPGTYEDRHRYNAGICTVCGGADPDYHEHAYGDWYETVAPDCENSGLEERYCNAENCDTPVETREIPALGHSWGDWYEISSPTCTEAGMQQRDCGVCGQWETRETGYAEHYYENGSCTYCGEPEPSLFYRFRRHGLV